MVEWRGFPVLLKMFFLSLTGCGVFATGSICKEEFVVEYRRDLRNDAESHSSCAAFMFVFKWRGKTWW